MTEQNINFVQVGAAKMAHTAVWTRIDHKPLFWTAAVISVLLRGIRFLQMLFEDSFPIL